MMTIEPAPEAASSPAPGPVGRVVEWARRATGPFLTAYVPTGPHTPLDHAQLDLGVSEHRSGRFLQSIDRAVAAHRDTDGAVIVVEAADGDTLAIGLPDPVARPVLRSGPIPSLAPLVEAVSAAPAHALVELTDTGALVHRFPTTGEPSTTEVEIERDDDLGGSIAAIVDDVELVIVAGERRDLLPLGARLAGRIDPDTRVVPIDTSAHEPPDELADAVVRTAADHAARRVVMRLRELRFARSHDVAIEGLAETLGELEAGRLVSLLVHDDATDERLVRVDADDWRRIQPADRDDPPTTTARLVDAAVMSALVQGIEIVVLPQVHDDRGPESGIGGLVGT